MRKWIPLIGLTVLLSALSGCGKKAQHPANHYWVSDIKFGNPICITMKNNLGDTHSFVGDFSEIWPLVQPLDNEEGKLWVGDLSPFLKYKAKHPVPCAKPAYIVKKVPVYITRKVRVYITKKVPVYIEKKIYVKQAPRKVHYHKKLVHRASKHKHSSCEKTPACSP